MTLQRSQTEMKMKKVYEKKNISLSQVLGRYTLRIPETTQHPLCEYV